MRGEFYDEAEQVTGLAYGTLRDAKYVADLLAKRRFDAKGTTWVASDSTSHPDLERAKRQF